MCALPSVTCDDTAMSGRFRGEGGLYKLIYWYMFKTICMTMKQFEFFVLNNVTVND